VSHDLDPFGPHNLLDDYASYVERQRFRRRWLGTTVVVLVSGAAIVEPFAFNSTFLLSGLAILVAVMIAVGLALMYAGTVFVLGWSYARWMQDQGQTRPSIGQVLLITLLACALAIMFAMFAIHDRIDPYIAGTVAFLSWTNLSCALLGYGAEFWSRRQHKP
jgi:drug/metabolite transporter (DMT)-like permease